MKKFKIVLLRSRFGWKPDQRETLKGLGLKRPGQMVIRKDTPALRGMISKVKHLVCVEEINE